MTSPAGSPSLGSPTPAPPGAPTPRQLAWAALGAELSPAKSLQRLDAAAARVVSTVSVVATLLTGFGLVAAGLSNLPDAARVLAGVSVGLAFLSVLAALAAQTVTITRGLNAANLREVEDWYTKRFERRAPLTVAAGVLLVLAAAAAGTAVLLALAAGSEAPTFAVTRTTDLPAQPTPSAGTSPAVATAGATSTVTVDVAFRGLDDGQVASAAITVDGVTVATAAFTSGTDGTATRALTVTQVPEGRVIVVEAQAGSTTCAATLDPRKGIEVTCPSR